MKRLSTGIYSPHITHLMHVTDMVHGRRLISENSIVAPKNKINWLQLDKLKV